MQRFPQFLTYQAEIFSSYYTRYGEQNKALDFLYFSYFSNLKKIPSTDTRKIENYVLTKNIIFFHSSQNTFLKYGYLVFFF